VGLISHEVNRAEGVGGCASGARRQRYASGIVCTCRASSACRRKVRPLGVLVAEGAKSGVQRKDVRVTAKVGVDLLFAVPGRDRH